MTDDPWRLERDWASGVTGYPDPAIEILDPRDESDSVLKVIE